MNLISSFVPPGSRRRQLALGLATPGTPRHLAKKFRRTNRAGLGAVRKALEDNFFNRFPKGYLKSMAGELDLREHQFERLARARKQIVPWLDSAKTLDGAHILEIGCGTGSSTLALAEQGARVVAVDIDEAALRAAQVRCRVYGIDNVSFLVANALDVHRLLRGRAFDFIIFYATVEHMTHQERLEAMSSTWNMLPDGAMWCIVEAPNRLWFYDSHTSYLPFFNWLPDDLALRYSRFSPRPIFNEMYRNCDEATQLAFLRSGRGVSFHEFQLAMGKAETLDVVSSLAMFLRRRNMMRLLYWLWAEYQFESFLAKAGPKIHPGFYHPYLDLIIRKNVQVPVTSTTQTERSAA